ncbi:MAG: alpha/beta fold hydrolase [Verrucomicrobiales bacterium]
MKSAACEKPTVRMRETTWVARDGKEFGYTLWGKPAADRDQPPFAVIAIHGLSGAASDFWPVGEFIEKPGESGPAVYAPELRGQGNDPAEGDRGDIRSPRRWIEDAADFTGLVRARHPGVPVFWIGESLGSLIALHTAAGYPEIGPDGLILLAPIGEFRDRLPT